MIPLVLSSVLVVCLGSWSLLHLDSGVLDTARAPSFLSARLQTRGFRSLSADQRLQHESNHSFFVKLGKETLGAQTLQELGVSVPTGLFPKNAFLVHTSHEHAQALSRSPLVTWVGNLDPEHKITAGVFSGVVGRGRPKPKTLLAYLATNVDGAERSQEQLDMLVEQLTVGLGSLASQVQVASPSRISVDFRNETDVQGVAKFLAEKAEVTVVTRLDAHHVSNRYIKNVMETGSETLPNFAQSTGLLSFDLNLRGQDQVIGIADSGLDFRNCFFAEAVSNNPTQPAFATFSVSASLNTMKSSATLSRRKIVQYVPFGDQLDENPNQDGHGTHVSGIAAGYPASDSDVSHRSNSGMADRAKIAFFDIAGPTSQALTVPSDINRYLFPWAYMAGARIHSNSWGTENGGAYSSSSGDADMFSFNNKDFLILAAAGNSGNCENSFYSVGSPATAKNVLSVGATMNAALSWSTHFASDSTYTFFNRVGFDSSTMASFSSQGPTSDYRLKPEISAPGHWVISANNGRTTANCAANSFSSNVVALAGTSMATPAVAGYVAVIRQYLTEGYYPSGSKNRSHAFTPSGSLLKNLAIIGAQDVLDKYSLSGNSITCSSESLYNLPPRPWVVQGYGKFILRDSIYVPGQKRFLHIPSLVSSAYDRNNFFDRSIAAGQTHTYAFCVFPEASIDVRVSLVWTDPPASLISSKELVNDLDLVVFNNGGTYYGNLNGSEYLPNIYEILKQPVGLDRFNNYEVVYLREATSKRDISIQVKAFSVSVGPQPYSLVVTGHVARGSCASASAAGPAQPFVTDGSALLAQGNAVLSDTFVQPAPLPTGYAVPNEVSSSFSDGDDKPKDLKDNKNNLVYLYILLVIPVLVCGFLLARWLRTRRALPKPALPAGAQPTTGE